MSEANEAGLTTSTETETPEATQENVAAQQETTQEPADVNTEAEKTFTQKELDEIIQKRIAKAEAIADRRAMKAYKETLEKFAPKQPEPQADNGRPTQAQFANVDDYVEAMADWKLGQRDQEHQRQQQEQREKTTIEKTESFYAEAEKIPGFDREVFDGLPLTPAIANALIDSDVPAKLMAYMATHTDEVDRIARLSPARQAAEIGKLETKLASVAPVPKPSNAPPPIKPIGSRSNSSDLSKTSMDDYVEKRKAQGARWAR